MRFLDYWQTEMWPVVATKYAEVLGKKPLRQDEASGRSYSKLFEFIKNKKNIQMVTCNLAWTDPAANTIMQEDISLEMVENFTIETFLDPSMQAPVDSTVGEGAAASAADAEGHVDDTVANSKTHRAEVVGRKRIWRVPATPPKFLNIPIALTNSHTEPEKGKFRRYGMDAVVNGVWLAMFWALRDDETDVVKSLEQLILD